jgi:hypothetical protein
MLDYDETDGHDPQVSEHVGEPSIHEERYLEEVNPASDEELDAILATYAPNVVVSTTPEGVEVLHG